MSYTARIAAMKTAISDAIDAAVTDNENKMLTVLQLEIVLQDTISKLHESGQIGGVEAVEDA
jgi:hypothetical protein